MNWFYRVKKHWLPIGLAFFVAYTFLSILGNYTFLRIKIANSHSDYLKVYWTTEDNDSWSNQRSSSIYTNNRKKRYIVVIKTPLDRINKLRIDPSTRAGIRSAVTEVGLHNTKSESVFFKDKSSFSRFIPNKQIGSFVLDTGIMFKSIGKDPGFLVQLPPIKNHPIPYVLAGRVLILGILLAVLARVFPALTTSLSFVPIGMIFIAGSCLVLATITERNKHPDENTHLNNAKYYASHYLPPEVCSPESRYTYSRYGVSRLDRKVIAYYIGGRYLELLDAIPSPDYIKLRLFNVALFFILAFLAFRQPKSRVLFLPLLLTPQAWYPFAYYNNDALSLFSVFILAYQIFIPGSLLRKLLRDRRSARMIPHILILALIVCLQYWLKLNYIFYFLFLAGLAASWWLVSLRMPNLKNLTPAILAFALGTAVFSAWEINRHAINDFSISERVLECREKLAKPEYKPSTPPEKTYPNFRLRDKGVTLLEMFTEYNWAARIYFTGMGAYGHTEFLNDYVIYKTMSVSILLLFVYVVITIFLKGDNFARLATLSTLGSMLAITAAALYVTWEADFQPQGRYLLVYLPLFGSLLVMYSHKLNMKLVSILTLVPFILSLYSFFAIALVEIQKV